MEHDDLRRLRVASLHLRGLTPFEIRAALISKGLAGPDGNPPTLETVCADIEYVEKVWKTELHVQGARYKARVLAEIREARRSAWAQGDLTTVLRSLKQEEELLGLDKLLG